MGDLSHVDPAAFYEWLRERVESRDCGHGTDCWVWTLWLTHKGYAYADIPTRLAGTKARVRVHRAAYEILVEPIPAELVTDHLCRNRACVNPAHIEPVTAAENTRRALCKPGSRKTSGLDRVSAQRQRWGITETHCRHGHAFTLENTLFRPNGSRRCNACLISHRRTYRERLRAMA